MGKRRERGEGIQGGGGKMGEGHGVSKGTQIGEVQRNDGREEGVTGGGRT